MKNKNRIYWIWLSLICRPASRLAVDLIRRFGDPEGVFRASASELLSSGLVKEKDRVYSEILAHDLDEAKDIASFCDKNGYGVVTPDDKSYPSNLYSLRDAPIVLYVAGELPDFDKNCSVSVVGSRRMTDYGKVNSFRFGYGLAKGGAILVSGLALGVDSMAMASALSAGGVSVGILGSGIDVVYPKEHLGLYRSVIKNGAVITECPPGSRPQRGAFPKRNRIISALSQGTLVVEAAEGSGSLITARFAIYQGKDLFSVPGAVDREMSVGTNNLIKEGAFAVTDPADILERYEFVYPHTLDTSSSKIALSGVDLYNSSVRVAMKYGVATEGDRDNVYSRRAGKEYISGSPIVMSGDEGFDNEFEIPLDFGEKPTALPAVKPLKKPSKFDKIEPKRVDLELLSETDLAVYRAMKDDAPMIPEELISDSLSISDIMSSLTMLEIAGAVEAGAGGYFIKCACGIDMPEEE